MQKLSRFFVIFLILAGAAFFGISKTLSAINLNWTQSSAGTIWSARHGHFGLVFDNKMWVMGGATSGGNNDVWYSSDGANWTQATANAAWQARTFMAGAVFNNKMWIMGGTVAYGGLKNDVWYSSDGITWTQATANAAWPARYNSQVVVFNNKMWVLGGNCLSGGGHKNDVWYSSDGITWTQATSNAGWSARNIHAALVFNNKMWVLGGNSFSDGGYKNDVWYSSDGITWTQATSNAGWSARGWFVASVFNNKMWVMGGTTNSGKVNDVWYSSDGITWTQANIASWSARSEFVSAILNNKIWVMGGDGAGNDVWSAPIPHEVSCIFSWAQQVVVDGVSYTCDKNASRGYCNYTKAQQGIAECCNWYEGAGYSNCAGIGPYACIENWSCGAWSTCSGGQQTRTCTDTNSCGTIVTKPAVSQSCTCTENWSCGAWSACSAGQQTRTCTDVNNCQTTASKPATTQGCESLSCINTNPAQEVIMHYKVDGSGEQFMCNSFYSHCRISGMIGRCCPTTGASNSDCMVDYPARTILQGSAQADKKILAAGESWPLKGGLVLKAESIDAKANPRQVWLSLYNKGVKLDDKVIEQGKFYLYSTNYSVNYPDFNLFGVYTDSIFAGATSDMVQLRYAYHNSLWESEISCTENWSCGDWSVCSAGNQTRTCADANNCGTTISKPAVSQSCCSENWSCTEWSACANNQQTRTCSDTNTCGTVSDKPDIIQSCGTVCAESWSCGEWSSCSNSLQTRTCTDANSCGTIVGKPAISQSCSIVIPPASTTTLDMSCPVLRADDMVKVVGKPAIYVLNNELKVLYFPSGDEFKSWKPAYGGYIPITQECFDSLPVPTTYPAAVNFRPGSYVVKKASSDQLYVIEPNNTLAKVTPEAAAVLYGADYQVMPIADVFWPHYINRGTDVVAAVPHPGMLVKSGLTTYYVDFGNKIREVDSAGLVANEFQTKFVRPIVSTLITNLVAGENISDKVSALTDKTQHGSSLNSGR